MTKQSLFRENAPKTAPPKPTHSTHSLSLTCPWCRQEIPVSVEWEIYSWCITNKPAYTHFKGIKGSLKEMEKFVSANRNSKILAVGPSRKDRITLKVVPLSFTAEL